MCTCVASRGFVPVGAHRVGEVVDLSKMHEAQSQRATFESLPTIVDGHARVAGGRCAVVCDGVSRTWAELAENVSDTAAFLAANGVVLGSRVAALVPNALEFVEVCLAISKAGGIVVPLPAQLDAASVDVLVASSRASLLLVPAALKDRHCAPGCALVSLEEMRGSNSRCRGFPAPRADDAFSIIYSSGTTSSPKGVLHSHGARLFSAFRDVEFFGLNEYTTTLIATPLYRSMAWSTLIPTLVAGGVTVLLSEFERRRFLDIASEVQPTLFKLVPTQCAILLADERFESRAFDRLQWFVFGGSDCPPSLKAEIRGRFPATATEVYGATELGPISCLKPGAPHEKTGSVGVPFPGVDVVVRDERGDPVSPGVVGRIAVGSGSQFVGYVDADSDFGAARGGSRGVRECVETGDMGNVDADGYLWLAGRGDDVIITGGANIHPSDIERILCQHPNVAEAAVIGRPMRVLGETPVAFVTLVQGATTGAVSLMHWANSRLNPHQRLFEVKIMDELPRNDAGKVVRRQLASFL